MVSALRHLQHLLRATTGNPINKPMLVTDPARPPACQIPSKRLRLPRTLERMPATFLNQRVDLIAQLGVMLLPKTIVVPCRRPERNVHGKDTPSSPASNPRTASSSRSAFLGDRSRYSVSSIDAHSLAETSTAPSPRWRVIANGARSATTLSIIDFRFSRASE